MSESAPRRALVVGLGNSDRGDDAAGLLVARRVRDLAPPGVEVIEWPGDPSGLLDRWAGADHVIVVDAVGRGVAPGAVRRLAGGAASMPPAAVAGGTHDLGLAEVLRLAEAMGRLPGSVVVYGLGGADFSPGAAVSAAVETAVISTASLILDELTGAI